MSDPTESARRAMLATDQPATDLAASGEPGLTTAEMQAEYDVIGFMAPFVVVIRKADGVKGSLEFTHSPRRYFGFKADR